MCSHVLCKSNFCLERGGKDKVHVASFVLSKGDLYPYHSLISMTNDLNNFGSSVWVSKMTVCVLMMKLPFANEHACKRSSKHFKLNKEE